MNEEVILMHAVYKINPPKGKQILIHEEFSSRAVRAAVEPIHYNTYSSTPYSDGCDRVCAYEKGEYIPEEGGCGTR